MVAPIAAMMGTTLLSVAVALAPVPEKGASRDAPSVRPVQKSTRDGGGWKFTDGKRSRRSSNGRKLAALPERSVHRAPIAPAGAYQGLRLESKSQPPVPVPAAKGEAPVLTWVGFQRDRANQGVVFVQVDRPIEHKFDARRGHFELFLPGVKVTQKNHARTLDLRYFPQTAAKKVRTKVTSKGTKVSVFVRQKTQPVVTSRPGPDGQHQILIAFPPTK